MTKGKTFDGVERHANGDMAKSADASDLKSLGLIRIGSNPIVATTFP